ncbi:MAG: hypothetical protein KKF44_02650 [Nanoarchaeota archaeon]|nr:hypothetical protein [Nanoarchaeota archaeon]
MGDDLDTQRREIAEQIYDGLVKYAKYGTLPDESKLEEILGKEMQLWNEHSPEWRNQQQNTDFPKAEVLKQSFVPIVDEMLRNQTQRDELYFGNIPPSLTFSSSGTSLGLDKRAMVNIDAITAPLYSMAVIACFSQVVRDMEKQDFLEKMEFLTYEEAVTEYESAGKNPVLLGLKNNDDLNRKGLKPFGRTINGFPVPYAKGSYKNVATGSMYVVQGADLIARVFSEEIVNPVKFNAPNPYELQVGQVADYLENRDEKPIMMQLTTAMHPEIYKMIEDGVLPDLKDGDLIWSGGGNKSGRPLAKPTKLHERPNVMNANYLGDNLTAPQWISELVPPTGIAEEEWMTFRDPHLYSVTSAYDPTLGIVDSGNRLAVDLMGGLNFPSAMMSLRDNIEMVEGGFRYL